MSQLDPEARESRVKTLDEPALCGCGPNDVAAKGKGDEAIDDEDRESHGP